MCLIALRQWVRLLNDDWSGNSRDAEREGRGLAILTSLGEQFAYPLGGLSVVAVFQPVKKYLSIWRTRRCESVLRVGCVQIPPDAAHLCWYGVSYQQSPIITIIWPSRFIPSKKSAFVYTLKRAASRPWGFWKTEFWVNMKMTCSWIHKHLG